MDANSAALADFATRHRKLFVLTGAGCSTESGIPDYRDLDGEWKRPSPVTYQAFMGEESTRKRYWARSLIGWPTMAGARPGAAHRALAKLGDAGRVGLLLTQNVDGLHDAAGSRGTVDLHGRIDTVRCMGCERRTPRSELQLELRRRNPRWAELEARAAPDGDADLEGRDFSTFDVPACPHCGGLLKPDVVFFGESVPKERVAAAFAALEEADAVLVAGSSLMVYSGFRFVQAAAAAGKPVAAVNLGRTRADALLSLKVEQPVGEALTTLARQLA
ncbi:NAD-dependent protein deacetylase [Variovorax sp. 375MFSha3.1]|uniref:NAD-dependent protein deacetylase n=1 Tax=Variovorax guangxiensis TaxID=1775474 RepID=A0A840FIQ3_9BURK|nr:NAD-dependent protein deacetylase [Variovorax guangxiensis]MBB4221463.1 NAD-dependent SIR2 family protein deacetylase [Variovorax guangxiensis]